jgi:parallel beta-helix repeat protein
MATVILIGSNQTITDNELSDFYVTGSCNLIARNTGRGMQLTGERNVVDQNYFSIIPRSDGGSLSGIHLKTGDHNMITGNTAIGQGTGIYVGHTGQGGAYNIFAGNRIEQARWGILMSKGSYNLFYGNLIANSNSYGLAMGGHHLIVESNLFFHNTFVNNSRTLAPT